MCEAGKDEVGELRDEVTRLEEQIASVNIEWQMVPDGPTRGETRSALKADIVQLEEQLAKTEEKLETLAGPKPKMYSAVARMRLKDGTMTDGVAGTTVPSTDEDGKVKVEADSILPPMSGLVNIFISLAVVVAVGTSSGSGSSTRRWRR